MTATLLLKTPARRSWTQHLALTTSCRINPHWTPNAADRVRHALTQTNAWRWRAWTFEINIRLYSGTGTRVHPKVQAVMIAAERPERVAAV